MKKTRCLPGFTVLPFLNHRDLKSTWILIEKAKQADHRKIGKELDLFNFHDQAPGFPFFHPKGMILRNAILDYWRQEHQAEGYEEIKTPIILSNELMEDLRALGSLQRQ
ncbi:MAG: hypothetical protein U5N58_00695 [Actinomycetota bacterium]|nr:hypothetical protein [Actinomycetota bacterium]